MTPRAGRGRITSPGIGIDVRPNWHTYLHLYLWLQDVCSHRDVG